MSHPPRNVKIRKICCIHKSRHVTFQVLAGRWKSSRAVAVRCSCCKTRKSTFLISCNTDICMVKLEEKKGDISIQQAQSRSSNGKRYQNNICWDIWFLCDHIDCPVTNTPHLPKKIRFSFSVKKGCNYWQQTTSNGRQTKKTWKRIRNLPTST